MVGTRRATPYGQTMCNRLVEACAALGSGALHRERAGVRHRRRPTGQPWPQGYEPSRYWRTRSPASCRHNTRPWRDSLDHGGALVTFQHSQTGRTARHTWPATGSSSRAGCRLRGRRVARQRRVVATAHCADGYDRSVMAVPGRATDGMSSGTNHLIRNRKAQP